MTRYAVFAYGSLVSAESVAHTLGPPLRTPVPARLVGHRRRWSTVRDNLTSEKTFARTDDGSLPRYVLGLNLEPADDDPSPNGALIEVSEADLERLDLREMRYRRLDVTEQLIVGQGPAGVPGFDRVVAYVARPEHFAPVPPPDAVVIARYVRSVERAFGSLGQPALRVFRETTEPPPVEIIEATLVRDRIPAGNPREW